MLFLLVRKVFFLNGSNYYMLYYSTSSPLNSWSSFFKKTLFGEGTSVPSPQTSSSQSVVKKRLPRATNEEVLETIKTLGTTMFPHCDNWTDISIADVDVKSKVLCHCEKELRRTIPNRALGSITTLGQLVSYLHEPPREPPGLIFPDLRGKTLPPNLSVEFPPKRMATRRAPYRKPFQNYDNPAHATFPNKKKRFQKHQVRS